MSEHKHRIITPHIGCIREWWKFRKSLDEVLTLYKCKHTHTRTKDILAGMGLEPCCQWLTLGYFIANGGYCDCEVLMNVGAERRDRPKRIRKRKPAKKAKTKKGE